MQLTVDPTAHANGALLPASLLMTVPPLSSVNTVPQPLPQLPVTPTPVQDTTAVVIQAQSVMTPQNISKIQHQNSNLTAQEQLEEVGVLISH